jgi:glycosyltransferase involved in cell wall biosynthesis
VLFLGYNFGLPVIASDVGSLGEDVVEGKTGFVCRPRDSENLAAKIDAYFASDLFADLEERREGIQQLAAERNSWTKAARRMVEVYEELGLPHRVIKK